VWELVLKLGTVWGDGRVRGMGVLSRGQLSGGCAYVGVRRRPRRTREGNQEC